MGKIKRYENPNGPKIAAANAPIMEVDGLFFKDLARTGTLLPYEDWRLSDEERAKDLASRLSVEEIAGLMLYSPHQMVPAQPFGPFPGTYDGKTLEESGAQHWDLTDQQKNFMDKDHVRHVLAMALENAETAAKWSNSLQEYAESLPWGIPVNISSDPRHGSSQAGAEYKSGAGDVSKWPEGLGMAATFSPETCRAFGDAVSKECRAMGITTALFPQVDLATEPRWMRLEDTFGSHPQLVTDFSRAYCDSLQTTEGSGWGRDSICAMAKHWPGGGPCEGGRDAHYPFGRFAVYPGNNLKDHLKPFLEGAFQLDGPTGCAAAIMPYYTVSWGLDQKDGKNVGNSYSHYLIHDLLREKYGYEGVVCTDWGITADPEPEIDSFSSRCYGVEHLTEAQRHLLAIENGVDQFGGNSAIAPILEAYQIGCERHGEKEMRARMEQSAVRLLKNIFRCGLFEDPYLDPEESVRVAGCEAFCRAGYEAQLRSIVMVKNQGVLPQRERKRVYIPTRHIGPMKGFFRNDEPEREVQPVTRELAEKYFDWSDTPEDADFALVFVESPLSDGGYSRADREKGGNGYVPITLQYRPYQAKEAREHSIAGGDPREDFTDRGYQGKTGVCANEADLDLILDTKKRMGDKPVIVVLRMHKPTVPGEFEPSADGILIDFGVQSQAILDVVSGKAEPSGLLPVQMPENMETVERHCEDVPLDMTPYTDGEGHSYDFGFGMNWDGVIEDERTRRYVRE